MKYHILGSFFIMLLIGCKPKNEENANASESIKAQTILEKVANAHGFDHWKKVKSIKFTFNVNRDSSHFERTWIWKPEQNHITAVSQDGDTLRYSRNQMDSVAFKANAGFINDRYWLLAPFNLIWDANNFTYEHVAGQQAPISKSLMQKLTIVYGSEGGYTPGDAYDFYFEDDFLIQEWVFRKSNQSEPSTITTWEDYNDYSGLKLASMHHKDDDSFTLSLSGIEVVSE
ncbi:MAG: hypothetical protein AAGB24_14745 [Bacteroidota bacterium]